MTKRVIVSKKEFGPGFARGQFCSDEWDEENESFCFVEFYLRKHINHM